MNNFSIRKLVALLLAGASILATLTLTAGGASATDTEEVSSTTSVESSDRSNVRCTNTAYDPVVVTVNGARYLQARARIDCTGPVSALNVKLWGCRQDRGCEGPYENTAWGQSSVQVLKRWPCYSANSANWATVAKTYGNGVLMGSLRAPGTGWAIRSCS